ncbi:MAG TPA: glucose 1-dehydrogenase [Acidimicrobiales bacterium]|nr:glucose 1-dehydrogenase [Acidimicrobiales bacterium]
MSGRLDGKVALITGGARGTGAATAARFVEEGARVVIADILDDEGRATATELGATYAHLDVTSEADWGDVMAVTVDQFGPLNILVNNAAILLLASLANTTVEDFERVMRVNALGTFLGIRAAIEPMKAAGGGSIINVSSIDGVYVAGATSAYSASKFAVRGLTKTAAVELGTFGIRVNAVCPEAGNPDMVKPFMEKLDPSALANIKPPPRPPLKRRPEMLDVANTIVFLASDESGFYSGADFVLDGGQSVGYRVDIPGL